ncbi:3-beta-hydroxysteroid dehydrogenase [subsurface metagenome]
MSGRLNGKVAVVTGGASGFGKGIATTYRKEGAEVVITDLSEDTGSAVAKEIGATFVRADVTKREDWEKVLKSTVDAHGRLDIVVNNAGTTYPNKVSSLPSICR